MKIALVDKSHNNVRYDKHYGIPDIEVFHMCSTKLTGRLLKKNIDLGTEANPFTPEEYDYVILVGAEPFLQYANKKGIGDYTGKRVSNGGYENYLASISPAQLHFKPEMKPLFEATVENIQSIIAGHEKIARPGDWRPIVDELEAIDYLTMVYNMVTGPVSFDSETSALYARDGYLLGLSVSHQEYQGVYIDADVIGEEVIELFQMILDKSTVDVVFQNLKFDMHFYKFHLGLSFQKAYEEKRLHDTMLQHYILDERTGTHGLKSLAMKYTDMGDYDFELDQFKTNYCKAHGIKKEDFSYDLIPFEIMWPYAAKDTDATIRLHNFFLPKIEKNPQLRALYYEVLMPGCMFLQRVEDRGVPVSRARLKESHIQLVNRLDEARTELYQFDEVRQLEEDQGSKFNSNSVIQLRRLLFDYIGLEPTGKLTDTGADSTDAEVLEKLASQHPIAKTLLILRKTTKLISTYIEKILDNIDADGCVRTGFHLHTTTSGRLSSSGKLNLQQLPRDESFIKGCIVAPPGYRVISWDLTTAEVYYAAVLSGDRNMQQVFINMKNEPEKYPDFHSNIAHMVFKLTCEPREVKKLFPALRQAAKAITFGILYGSGPAKVAQAVNEALLEESLKTGKPYDECTVGEAREYIDVYFGQFPQLKRWIEASHEKIVQNGYIYSHFGRKRRLLNIKSEDRSTQGEEIRSGFNAIIQSVSSDTLLLGAIEADEAILKLGLEKEMKIIMLVHDSVVAIVREDLVDQYNELLMAFIQKDRGVSIPNCPIGVDSDSEEGGSRDYSCGKLKKQHPSVAIIDDPAFQEYLAAIGIEEYANQSGKQYSAGILKDKDNYERILETLC